MHFIEFSDVSKIYGSGEAETRAVDGASFCIEKGDFCVVVGHSGAGKTTILNLLGGMDSCTSGNINVDGFSVSSCAQRALTTYRRQDVGFVFQFYNLVSNLTARENVELAADICKNSLDAFDMLARVGLSDRAGHFPAQLSGGEQQRVSIARALAKNPKLLLCDEPTGALDDTTGRQVLRLLLDMNRALGMTVVLITHNSAIARIAGRVIKVRSGKIAEISVNPNPLGVDAIEW